VFAWRPLVAIGVMSYSLYLVHQPLVGLLAHALGGGQGVDPRRVFLQQVALFPLILVVAFALFATVEWRSISARGPGRVSVHDLLFPRVHAPDVPAPRSPAAGLPEPAVSACAEPAVPARAEPAAPAGAQPAVPARALPAVPTEPSR
jgi:peptidoglycan/LPS O-acetylase OafA/YrhL